MENKKTIDLVEAMGLTSDGPDNRIILQSEGGVLMPAIKSGATQGSAGAAAGEFWKTTSHATLPDNVLMIGV